MATSTLTKLDIANNVLNACGERAQTSTAGVLGNVLTSCLREAIWSVCGSADWNELRSVINASSWSADAATLPDTTYRIRNVFWYTSPDGQPETNYDYYHILVPYVDLEQYKTFTLVPFESNANSPCRWTIETKNKVLVNPYPTNTVGQNKVFFEVFRYPELPSTDTSNFNVSDLLTNLIQYKASVLFAIKHLNDNNLAQIYMLEYDNLAKQNRISDSGQSTQGYNMYRSRRQIARW